MTRLILNHPKKRIAIYSLILLLLLMNLSYKTSAQSIRHFNFFKKHKTRFVNQKRINRIYDSSAFSFEIITGNQNAWNGDMYNEGQSLQLLFTYDNNSHWEFGAFAHAAWSPESISASSGADAFASYAFNKHWAIIEDVFAYGGNTDNLKNLFGYTAENYYQNTLRLQYQRDSTMQFYAGYAFLNDPAFMQQSFMLEYDKQWTPHWQWVLGYASDNDITNVSFAGIYAGINWRKNQLFSIKGLQVNASFIPTNINNSNLYWPVSWNLIYSFE